MDYTALGSYAALGPIFLGALIALAAWLKWPVWVFYVLAAVSILWGIQAL